MKKLLTFLLCLTLTLTMMPSLVFADGADTGTVDGEQVQVVTIKDSDELVNAIKDQEDNQIWSIEEGTYDIKEGCVNENPLAINGESGFVFPITASNLTIRGEGNVMITSSYDPGAQSGGVWHYQNFITISGSNVTIENVSLRGNPNDYYGGQCNKVIELVGEAKNFTLRDVNLLPIEDNEKKVNSGSIYFSNTDAGTTILENVTMYSWINARNVKNGTITADNVVQDFRNNTYAGYHDDSGNYYWNPGISTSADTVLQNKDFTVKVDDKIELNEQVCNANLKAGTTIEVTGTVTVDRQVNLNKKVTLKGADENSCISVDHETTGSENSAGILVTAPGTVIENLKVDGPNDVVSDDGKPEWVSGQYVIKIYDADDVIIRDVTLTHGSGAIQANKSKVTVDGELNFDGNTYNGIEVNNGGTLTMTEQARIVVTDNSESVIWKDTKEAGTIITNGTIAQTVNSAKENEHRFVAQAPAIADNQGGYYLLESDAAKYVENDSDVTLLKDVTITKELADKVKSITAKEGVKVTNNSGSPIVVETPNGSITVANGETVTSQPYEPPYIPPTPTTQKPTVEADANATVVLSSYGTIATITVAEGYELVDVVLNGVSQGKVTTVTGLKTGDKLVVTTRKIVNPDEEEAAKNARLKEGVENTTIKLTSTLGDGFIKLNWKKSLGYKVDYYEVYKSTKRYSGFGTKPYFETKQGGITGWYKNTKELKKGTRYYYKVRGVRDIAGETVYTQYSNKAWRLVK